MLPVSRHDTEDSCKWRVAKSVRIPRGQTKHAALEWFCTPLSGRRLAFRAHGGRGRYDAERFADAWRERYPDRPVPTDTETFEVSEYGRAPTEEDLNLLLG